MKMARSVLDHFLILAVSFGTVSPLEAQLINGGFESGDFSGWNISPYPAGLHVVGGVQSLENGAPPFDWLPQEGNNFAWLVSGWSFNGQHMITGINQLEFPVQAGQAIEFDFFFDAGDALPNNDTGCFSLSVLSDNVQFSTTYCLNVATVGDYGDSGWQHFIYPTQFDGSATLKFTVFDQGPNYSNFSAIGIDGVAVVPEPAAAVLLLAGLSLFLLRVRVRARP